MGCCRRPLEPFLDAFPWRRRHVEQWYEHFRRGRFDADVDAAVRVGLHHVRAAGVGGGEHQGPDPLQISEAELLGDEPAEGGADHVCAALASGVEPLQVRAVFTAINRTGRGASRCPELIEPIDDHGDRPLRLLPA